MTSPHASQLPNSSHVDVHEPLNAVGEAGLFRAVEGTRLEGGGGGHALFPAEGGEGVGFYTISNTIFIFRGR